VMGEAKLIKSLRADKYADDKFGVPTVTDILKELEKPGRDPRPEFTTATFQDGVETLADLMPGMILEGVVTNVAAFGAFVDIGVHQDGLVHISALAEKFVKDPHEVVKAGQVVKVKVMEVDIKRQRVALTMRLNDTPTRSQNTSTGAAFGAKTPATARQMASLKSTPPPQGGAMAAAFDKLAQLKGRV
jgi:protein Tex